jgi:hypothetical protein
VNWLRDIALILGLGWLLLLALTTASAQEPTPEPTPAFYASICEGANIEGGATRILGEVEITLPPGTYGITIPPPDAQEPGFYLCHQESGGVLYLNSTNCDVIERSTPDSESQTVIDSIVASCHIAPTPTPEPTPVFSCPQGETISGDTTVTIGDNLQVSLPSGNFVIHINENDIAQICNVDEEFSVYLDVSNCTSPVIAPPNDPHQEAIQEIKASCITLSPTPTPDPAISLIQPPNTGDGGLLP